ncbi:MAG: protein kinase [Planctomycetes bacterium]|nr:protein kinase [Planctomycetota bacterium]
MDKNRFARLGEIFAHARGLSATRCAVYLDEVCGDDAGLRKDAEELLAEDSQRGGSAIDRVLGDDEDLPARVGRSHPRQIGKYRILGICGAGGMGTVYEAEDCDLGRRVALKVIQSATMRPELLSRFRREAKILARLEHPCIASVFEVGEFGHEQDQLPFFAMEFVEGQPPLAFASQRGLGVAARVDIFLQMCDAIEYAHRQGVVHRDLKPDNILVVASPTATTADGSSGQPKILDFGVASLTEPDTHATMVTGAGQLLGSVPYMSPEQATGTTEAVGFGSDVYSLGVVLFELLTGRLPYDVSQRPLADALHAIRHDEPTRLGSVDPALRGDLETIVGMCLEKDLERRYQSVAAVAADLRRYRAQQPISARPPSTWYQLRRFTARHRALVGGVLTTALALVAGAIIAVIFAFDASRSADQARENQLQSDRQAYRANLTAASALLESDPEHTQRLLDEVPAASRGWEWRYLMAARSGLLHEFGAVRPPASPPVAGRLAEEMFLLEGGDHVLARTSATTFCIWETRTGRLVRTFEAPASVAVWAAATGGNLLAAALEDGRVVTANPRSDRPTWETWRTRETDIRAIAVDPRGQQIALHREGDVRFGCPDAWHVLPVATRGVWRRPLLAFGPDGTEPATLAVLAGIPKDSLALWDAGTGVVLGEPMPSVQVHWSIAITPGGRVASGQLRREIRLFDPATGELDFELLGHNGAVRDLAVSRQGRLLSVGSNSIRVWDLERQQQVAIFDAPDTSKAEFVDEDHILSLTAGRFRLWTLRDPRARTLVGHDGHVFSVVFSGDGGLLASSAPWGDVIVWDPLEATPLRRVRAELHQNIAFDRSGEHLLHAVHWWGPMQSQITPWPGGSGALYLPEQPCMVHGVAGGKLRIDDAQATPVGDGLHFFRTLHTTAGEASAAAFVDGKQMALQPREPSPPGSRAASLGDHPRLSVGDMGRFGGSVAELLVFAGELSPREGTAIDDYLAVRRTGGHASLPTLAADSGAKLLVHFRAGPDTVRINDGNQVRAWTASNDKSRALTAHGGSSSVALLPATAGLPARVSFHRAYGVHRWLETALPGAAGEQQLTVCWLGGYRDEREQRAYGIGSHAFSFANGTRDERITKRGTRICHSSDDRYVVNAGPYDFTGPVDVWDAITGECVAHFEGRYNGVSFHPDSTRIAAARHDGGIDIFDVPSQRLLAAIEAHKGPCWDVAFSPDGTRLASGGNDNALRLWDAGTYERLIELPGHRSYVRCVAWSADGTMLASACADYRVRIWDSVSRRERYGQQLVQQALEGEVRAQVDALHQTLGEPDAVMAELRKLWPEGSARRRAAMKVLARLQ